MPVDHTEKGFEQAIEDRPFRQVPRALSAQDSLSENIVARLDWIQECRHTLISAAVTGKIDVWSSKGHHP